jgi:hypothetical protein
MRSSKPARFCYSRAVCVLAYASVIMFPAVSRPQCVPIAGVTQHTVAIPSRTCFSLTVHKGEAVQMRVTQPRDVEIRVTGKYNSFSIDAFEFGLETATICDPGTYKVFLRARQGMSSATALRLSARWMPASEGNAWRESELRATLSKHTLKPSDISESLLLWQAIGNKTANART